jgi:uncharacterized RDD family membrane protein YckC
MGTNDSFSWGAETLERGGRSRRRSSGRRRGLSSSTRTSLLSARAAAVLLDGLVLLVPVFAVAFLLSLVFPHHGFFFHSTGPSGSANVRLGLPGVLVISALSLSYFFLFEALRGQTIGKRRMGLRVQSAEGGPAGLNAISARTVLRLIDGLVFYAVGALIAALSGSRRRRLGDWLGGTVVVYDDSVSGLDAPGRPLWQVLAYPLSWTIAVLLAVFALGLGTAAGAEEQAISLVQSYVKAREQGNGALACSMLSREQQRELVAIQTRDYPHASAARCADLILSTDPASHLLNPGLGAFAAGPLEARYNSAGFALVGVAGEANTVLVVVFEHGRPKLDIRGAEKLGFEKGCAGAAGANSAQCDCVFSSLRAEGLVDAAFRGEFAARVRADGRRCRRA